MAIYITTLKQAEKVWKKIGQNGECFEIIIGKAKNNYICDLSIPPIDIPKGEICACFLILPNKNHFNYEHQKGMLGDYVEVIPNFYEK